MISRALAAPSTGSTRAPNLASSCLSDTQLEAKFGSLVVPVLGQPRADEITKACRTLASLPDVRALTALCRA